MKYQVEFTEKQMSVIQQALEEYFRLRLGQCWDFADDIVAMGLDLSPDNPNHDEIFDRFIVDRDWVRAIMEGIFRNLWPIYGVPQKKSEDVMISECIWDSIRCARGLSRYSTPMKIGGEPIPKITKEKEASEGGKGND